MIVPFIEKILIFATFWVNKGFTVVHYQSGERLWPDLMFVPNIEIPSLCMILIFVFEKIASFII